MLLLGVCAFVWFFGCVGVLCGILCIVCRGHGLLFFWPFFLNLIVFEFLQFWNKCIDGGMLSFVFFFLVGFFFVARGTFRFVLRFQPK